MNQPWIYMCPHPEPPFPPPSPSHPSGSSHCISPEHLSHASNMDWWSVSFRMDWLNHLAVQGTLKSLLQHHISKISILWRSAFFTVQLSHPYMTTGKTIALSRWFFVGKVMSLLFNVLSRLVVTFLPGSKCLLISLTFIVRTGYMYWTPI